MVIKNPEHAELGGFDARSCGFSVTIVCENGSEQLSSEDRCFFLRCYRNPYACIEVGKGNAYHGLTARGIVLFRLHVQWDVSLNPSNPLNTSGEHLAVNSRPQGDDLISAWLVVPYSYLDCAPHVRGFTCWLAGSVWLHSGRIPRQYMVEYGGDRRKPDFGKPYGLRANVYAPRFFMVG